MRDSTGGVSGGVHKVHGGSAFLKAVGGDPGGSEHCGLAQPQAAPGGAACTAPPTGSTYYANTDQGSQSIMAPTGWQAPQASVLRAPAASDAFPFQPSLAYAPPQPHHHPHQHHQHHPSAPTMQHPPSHYGSQNGPHANTHAQPQGVYYATGEQQHGQAYTWQSYHAHSTTTGPPPNSSTHGGQPSFYSCSAPGSFCITGGVTTWHTNPQQQQYLYQQQQHQHQQMLIHSNHGAGHLPPHSQSAATLGSGGSGGGVGNVDRGPGNAGAEYDPTADVDVEPEANTHGGVPASVQGPACGQAPSVRPSASPHVTLHGRVDQQYPQDGQPAPEGTGTGADSGWGCSGSGGCAGGGLSLAHGAGDEGKGVGAREGQAAGEQPGELGVEAGAAAGVLPLPAHASAPHAGHPCAGTVVAVWDLDETLIVFNSLLSGAFAKAMGAVAAAAGEGEGEGEGEGGSSAAALGGAAAAGAGAGTGGGGGELLAARALALGQRMADVVFDFCDAHLGFNLLDSMDPVDVTELCTLVGAATLPSTSSSAASAAPADGPLAKGAAPGGGRIAAAPPLPPGLLERIATVYGSGSGALQGLLGEGPYGTLAGLMAEAEGLTGGWVAAGRRLLAEVKAGAAAGAAAAAGQIQGTQQQQQQQGVRVQHVLVSAGHLVATLGKLLLWGLDAHFDIEDVYSASGRSKLDVFRRIAQRFGPQAAYVAVGDGNEEHRAAGVMGWGFVRVALGAGAAAGGAGAGAEKGAGEQARSPLAGGAGSVGRRVADIAAAEVLGAALRQG